MTRAVDISVVIPTLGHRPELRRTLEALAGQELPGVEAEVIVVADAFSPDAPGDVFREAGERPPLPLTVLHESAPGAAAARNKGLGAAVGDLVLFLPDDCAPADSGLLAGHVGEHREAAASLLVAGGIEWDPALEPTALMEWLARSGATLDYGRLSRDSSAPYLFYMANVSAAREDLLAVGGFDQRFQAHDVEDHDLATRLAERGLELAHRPDLLVHHAHRYELAESLARAEAIGRGLHLLRRLERRMSPARVPRGAKAFAGRLLAPLFERTSLGDRRLSAAHYALTARGYGGFPLPDLAILRGGPRPPARADERPAVSVVVPFSGDRDQAVQALRRLEPLALAAEDELILVDNSPGGALLDAGLLRGAPVVAATAERSSYYARNVGADRARNDWILFVDADCRPSVTLLDEYFAAAIEPGCGAVAGSVLDTFDERSPAGRYARARRRLSQDFYLDVEHRPFAVTANLLVRRDAWAALGGFLEGIRSGGDADFCWRLQDAGWSIAYRPEAAVEHVHRDRVRDLLRQQARYGAARAWLGRRHPGSWRLTPAIGKSPRFAAALLVWSATAHFERAVFRAIDLAIAGAESLGYLLSNAPRSDSRAPAEILVLCDSFPSSDTVAAEDVGAPERPRRPVRVEALARPARPVRGATDGLRVSYLEDDGHLLRLGALCWLVARHPLRSAADLLRRRGRALPLRVLAPPAYRLARCGERQLRAQPAAATALAAKRLSRLSGVPCSLMSSPC